MVVFAINNSVHAFIAHTPFCVHGFLHPRVLALIQSNYGIRKRRNASRKNVLAFDDHVLPYTPIMFNANVDNVNIEEDELSSSTDAAACIRQ